MASLTDIVLRNLQLIRSRTPSVAEANTWVEEFNRKLGSIDPERLQAAFDAAREEAAGTTRYRPLHFDVVQVEIALRQPGVERIDLPRQRRREPRRLGQLLAATKSGDRNHSTQSLNALARPSDRADDWHAQAAGQLNLVD